MRTSSHSGADFVMKGKRLFVRRIALEHALYAAAAA